MGRGKAGLINTRSIVVRSLRPLVGGVYREIVNTDSAIYGGSNVGNAGAVIAENSPSHGMPFSLTLRLPPLGRALARPPHAGRAS